MNKLSKGSAFWIYRYSDFKPKDERKALEAVENKKAVVKTILSKELEKIEEEIEQA